MTIMTLLGLCGLLPAMAATAGAAGTGADGFTAAAGYSAKFGGRAVLVVRDGQTLFEQYDNRWSDKLPHPLASGSKSFTGVMAMLAVQDGLLTLDERAADTIVEWKDDPRKSKILVRHLLDLSSGLEPGDQALGGRGGSRLLGQAARLRAERLGLDDSHPEPDDKFRAAVDLPMRHEPGERFEYGPGHYAAFGELLQRKLAASDRPEKTVHDYLLRRLMQPIGIERPIVSRDKAGNPNLPGGILLTARDWARFGQFVLDGGSVRADDGTLTPLLDPDLLKQCFEPSAANPNYGLTWWLRNHDPQADTGLSESVATRLLRRQAEPLRDDDGAVIDIYMAAGLGKQRLYVIPAYRLAVVRFAEGVEGAQAFNDVAFLKPILEAAGKPEPVSAPASAADRSLPWIVPEVRAPGVSPIAFDSAAAGGPVSVHVYTPKAYGAEPDRRFPVLYWLHGGGSRAASVAGGVGPIAERFDAAIRDGHIPPLLVVFPNGLPMSLWSDSSDGRAPVETATTRDLIAFIDANYRTIASREGRIVEGFSMGGYGAARYAFHRPDLFAAASVLSGGPLQREFTFSPRTSRRGREEVLDFVFGGDPTAFVDASPWSLAEGLAAAGRAAPRLRVVIGDADEMIDVVRAFHGHLERLKIPHEYVELPGVGHTPLAVLDALGDRFWAFHRAALD